MEQVRVRVVSRAQPWLIDDQLDMIVKSGAIQGRSEVVDLKDYQRALVWIDGRFARVLGPGLHAYWLGTRDVRVEVIDTKKVRLEHDALKAIVRTSDASRWLDVCKVERDCVGVLSSMVDMSIRSIRFVYASGRMWQMLVCVELDMRESQIDVSVRRS